MDPRESGKQYTDALDALRDQRKQIEEDQAFTDPADPQQWDEAEKRQRETDPGGKRPCLVLDQVGQYVANVTGQIEKQPPSLHSIPVGGGADKKVAEYLDGYFRHIEHASRAKQHYATAHTSAARVGVGYLIVRPEVCDRALNYQEPRITSEGDALRVVFDPWSIETDGSDAECGWHLTALSHKAFERLAGKEAAKISFGDDQQRKIDDERTSITIAECWHMVEETRDMIVCAVPDGESFERVTMPKEEFIAKAQAEPRIQFISEYKDKTRAVKWSRMSGAEEISKETEFPASGIGIVPVYGYISYRDGRMRYCGMGRRAREPQRAYNWHMSEARAAVSAALKTPLFVPISALGDGAKIKELYDRSSVEQRAWLPYQDWDSANSRPIAPPSRAPLGVDVRHHMLAAEQAKADIQAALAMYQANLGAPSNETSGVAIDARKEQGDSANSHFQSHLAAALGQVGKLCLDMTQKLVDTQRYIRTIGMDESASQVMVNPQGPAFEEREDGKILINPSVGKYDQRIVVGASFTTQRSQSQLAFTEMMRANPAMAPAIAPMWAQSLDVPGADKLTEALIALSPPEIQAVFKPNDQEQSTVELKAQLTQAQQATEQAVQLIEQLQQENAQLEAKAQADSEKNEIAAYDAETKRMAALKDSMTPEVIQQIVALTMSQIMTPDTLEPDPMQPGVM